MKIANSNIPISATRKHITEKEYLNIKTVINLPYKLPMKEIARQVGRSSWTVYRIKQSRDYAHYLEMNQEALRKKNGRPAEDSPEAQIPLELKSEPAPAAAPQAEAPSRGIPEMLALIFEELHSMNMKLDTIIEEREAPVEQIYDAIPSKPHKKGKLFSLGMKKHED